MTTEEFDNTSYGKGDKVIYHDQEHLIHRVEFEERLFAFMEEDCDELTWVRCENCQLVSFNSLTQ